MILNYKDRQDLRRIMKEEIEKSTSDKYKINDLDLLERLLFETKTIIVKTKKNGKVETQKIQIKYLVWMGPFLSKLDLSGVSFDGICLDAGKDSTYQKEYGISWINLQGTNAKIDLRKTQAEGIHSRTIRIVNCNLAGCDLSGEKMVLEENQLIYVKNSNLSNTKLELIHDASKEETGTNFWLIDSNFQNCSLKSFGFRISNLKSDATEPGFYTRSYIENCNFKGSGLSVVDDIDKFIKDRVKDLMKETSEIRKIEKLDYYKNPDSLPNSVTAKVKNYFLCFKALALLIKHGKLGGCMVFNKKMLTPEEKAEEKERLKLAYEKYVEEQKAKMLAKVREDNKNR